MIKKYLKRIRRVFTRYREERQGAYLKYVTKPESVKSNKKKIIFIINEAFYGGVPILSINMIKNYISTGYYIDIVLLRGGILLEKFFELAPLQVCYSKKELLHTLRALKENGFDYAICNGIASARAVCKLDIMNIQFVSLIHELPGVIKKLDMKKSVESMIKLSKAIIFPSNFGKKLFEEEISKCSVETFIMHQGLYSITKSSKSKDECRKWLSQKYKFDYKRHLIINVATINERKGFDLFAQMAQLEQNMIFFWVGDGIDSKYANKVKLQLGGKFPENLILPGYINDATLIADVYSAADCLALTSREEPFGSVVLEAFSHETPVVAFDNCGGYIDVVRTDQTGKLVEDMDASSMLNAINNLFENTKKYSEIQKKCYAVASEANFQNYCDYIVKILMG